MKKVIVTIGRQYGSGGRRVGKALAEKLGIPFYNREIARMASDESGISEGLFNEADEKLRTGKLRGVTNSIYNGQLIMPGEKRFLSEDNLFYWQAKVIKDLADRESCVIVGRCADFVLRNRDDVVSAFIYGSREYNLMLAEEVVGLSGAELEKYVDRIDKYRAAFYHYYTGKDWGDFHNYDLSIDASKLGTEKVVELLTNYIELKYR